MKFEHQPTNASGSGYLSRQPEYLVLEGYRHWIAGFETDSVVPWEQAWGIYSGILGPNHGRKAMSDLTFFVRTLRNCAHCPLRTFPFGARRVCREECLVLGLISGIQHKTDCTSKICLDALTCPKSKANLAEAAAAFAATLASFKQFMVPVTPCSILDILERSANGSPVTFH